MGVYNYERWPIAIAVYPDDSSNNTILTVSSTSLTISSDSEIYSVSPYVGKSITDIVSEFNGNLADHEVVKTLDVGAEQITTNSIVTNSDTLVYPGSPHTFHYSGFIIRNREQSVIQLKPPRAQSRFESWYPRIGNGKIRARFQGINFQGYPGINPDATYEFSIPEFIRQEWSPNYGPPYKDAVGEIPEVVRYHPRLHATVLRVARRPIYWDRRNISIMIRGVRQSNSFIRDVDENNGLIYLNQKLGKNTQVSVDYSYKEEDYVYDAVDLNASIAHNPLIVDTYVAFYIKPSSSDGALISGGDAIFHQIVTTEAAGRAKAARIIPSTVGTSRPLYEPVIYLGSMNVRQGIQYDEFEIIDTRTRGGGLYPDKVHETPKTWREAEFFYDIGSFDGLEIPGNAAIVIKVPNERVGGAMQKQEIEERVTRDVALGVVPIIEFDEIPTVDWTESLTFGDDELTVEMMAMSPSITFSSISGSLAGGTDGITRTFKPQQIFRLMLDPIDADKTVVRVPGVGLWKNGNFSEGENNVTRSRADLREVTPDNFAYREIRNFGDRLQVKYSGLNVGGTFLPRFTAMVSGNVAGGTCYWNIHVNPDQSDLAVGRKWNLRGIEFPRFEIESIEDPITGDSETALLPYNGGLLVLEPHKNQTTGFTLAFPGLMSQYHGHWEVSAPNKGFFYWQTDDENWKTHLQSIEPPSTTGGFACFSTRTPIDKQSEYTTSEVSLPFNHRMKILRGDWYDAAIEYRDWSTGTILSNKPRLLDTSHPDYVYPSYITGLSCLSKGGPFGHYTGQIDWVNQAVDMHRQRDLCQSGAGHWIIQWGDWHANEFDTLWPDYQPIATNWTGGIDLLITGGSTTGFYPAPYINFSIYSITGQYVTDSGLTDKFIQDGNSNTRWSEIKGKGPVAYTDRHSLIDFMDTGVARLMRYPFVQAYTGTAAKAVYVDLWGGGGGTIETNDGGNSLTSGNYVLAAQAIPFIREFLNELTGINNQSEYPVLYSEVAEERFFGLFPLSQQKGGIGPTKNPWTGQFGSARTLQIPFMASAQGEWTLTAETDASIGGTVISDFAMQNAAWQMHQGKIPVANSSWTGNAQTDITVYANTGDMTEDTLRAWLFHRSIIQQHDWVAPYVYHGRRMRPDDTLTELSLPLTVGWLTGGHISFWQDQTGGSSIGCLMTQPVNITGDLSFWFDMSKRPELADKTGIYEMTDGINVWHSAFTYDATGLFNFQIPSVTGETVKFYHFR